MKISAENSISPKPSPSAGGDEITTMTRREALKRAALFLGVALSPSLISGVLNAQSATAGGAGVSGVKPVYLTAKQMETVSAVAERIIPRTDTPGAVDVGVPAFIDLMYGKYLSETERTSFTAGLADLEAASLKVSKQGFAQFSGAQQDEILLGIAKGASTKAKTFFAQIKELTVTGYFTSEQVGKKVLNYDPVPGRFDACVPLAEVGNKAWTK